MPTTELLELEAEKEETKEASKNKRSPLSASERKALQHQIETEYQLCWPYNQGKRIESLRRLKLYNNQRRDKAKVGDPLLFTVFNTVIAALYEDKLTVNWQGYEEGDDEAAENLTDTAKYDYNKMEKDEIDYEWIWDAGFFGRGLLMFNEFDRRKGMMCPVPEVLDPMTFIRDPRATSVNGNKKGNGAARFFGREVGLSKEEMESHPSYFNTAFLKKDKDIKNLTREARQARRNAQGLQETYYQEEALDVNYEYQLIEWFTHVNGKKYLTTWANGRKLLVRYQEIKADKWPVIDRPIYPMAHDWEGVSIPDLIEDKQRARSVMINLGMESAIADLYPMYLFDKTKIPNEHDLEFGFNKFIPVKGKPGDAIHPVQKSLFHQQVNLILNILDTAAQKSVAAPEVAQGVQPSKERTLGETELIVEGADTRHSLGARIFGWSEKRFWRQWYWLYKKNFHTEIDEKIIRITGPLNYAWRKLTRENLVTDVDPDLYIESSIATRTRENAEFQKFSVFSQIAVQEPSTNRKFVLRRMGKILGMDKMTMGLMFPPTIDEMRSDDENQKINDNKLPDVHALDDDSVHIEIHNKAADTAAKLAHIEAHKNMMLYKKEHPEQFPQPEALQDFKPIATEGSPEGKTPPSRGRIAPRQESSPEGQEDGSREPVTTSR